MNKLYSVHDHWTDINKKNDVDIESIDGVITGIKVNGEDYGGGESDLSMAKVTVINTSSEYANILNGSIVVDVGSEFGTTYEMKIPTNQTKIANVIMYKGNSIVYILDVGSTSGSIQSIGDDRYLITGDCTITIS